MIDIQFLLDEKLLRAVASLGIDLCGKVLLLDEQLCCRSAYYELCRRERLQKSGASGLLVPYSR